MIAAERLLDPTLECRDLIIYEYAPVLDCRLARDIATLEHSQLRLMAGGDVHPEVPRRNVDLVRDVVDPEHRPALVAPGDDKRLVDAFKRLVDRLNDVGLPPPGNARNCQLSTVDEIIDERALTNCADNDGNV